MDICNVFMENLRGNWENIGPKPTTNLSIEEPTIGTSQVWESAQVALGALGEGKGDVQLIQHNGLISNVSAGGDFAQQTAEDKLAGKHKLK